MKNETLAPIRDLPNKLSNLSPVPKKKIITTPPNETKNQQNGFESRFSLKHI